MAKNDRSLPPPGGEEENQFPLLTGGMSAESRELWAENMGNGAISTLDLPRDKCGAGGATSFTVQTPDGEEQVKSIECIIAAWRPARLYWKEVEGQPANRNRPPDCVSRDGFVGVGDPGGECAQCPYARFGSSVKGHRGQACKQIRQLLILHPGEIVPHLLAVPPTSLKACSAYFMGLLSRKVAYWSVVTRIALERATSAGGDPYARMLFTLARFLSEEERSAFHPVQREMKGLLSPVEIVAADYAVEEPADSDPDPPFQAPTDPAPAANNPDDIPF